MESHRNVALMNGTAEMLVSLLGDRNFELATSVTPCIVNGVIVGGCSFVGGLLGGRMGLIIGGSIGSFITSNFGAQIRSLSEMLQQLAIDQLRTLFSLLRREIERTIIGVLRQTFNRFATLENLLELFGDNPQVRSHIVETITNYFRGIFGNNLRLVEA